MRIYGDEFYKILNTKVSFEDEYIEKENNDDDDDHDERATSSSLKDFINNIRPYLNGIIRSC